MRKKSKMGTKMRAMGPGMAKGKKGSFRRAKRQAGDGCQGRQNGSLSLLLTAKARNDLGRVVKTMKKMYRGGMTSKMKPKGGKRGGKG